MVEGGDRVDALADDAYALAGAETDERDTALDMIALDPELQRRGQVLMGDKGYRRASLEAGRIQSGR